MAQTYQMKHNPQGTIYSLLTVESDGAMTMTFHGKDREISHEVTENADGWLCYPGAMFPGLESGRWKLINAAEQTAAEKQRTTAAGASDDSSVVSDFVADCHVREEEVEPVIMNHESLIVNQAKPARPRRQRKPRRPLAAVESRNDDTEKPENDYAWLQSAGYLAAASVALLIIWQTGLIIPIGLIGLATGGLLK